MKYRLDAVEENDCSQKVPQLGCLSYHLEFSGEHPGKVALCRQNQRHEHNAKQGRRCNSHNG